MRLEGQGEVEGPERGKEQKRGWGAELREGLLTGLQGYFQAASARGMPTYMHTGRHTHVHTHHRAESCALRSQKSLKDRCPDIEDGRRMELPCLTFIVC